jgi:hypothetical protein
MKSNLKSNLKALVAIPVILVLFFVAYPLHVTSKVLSAYVSVSGWIMTCLGKWSNS